MAYTNPKPLLEEIDYARKLYEKSLEAGDTAAADKHFSRVMDLKESLANVEKANEQHNLRYGTQETIDDIRKKAGLRELRIQLGEGGEAGASERPQLTGSGYRKVKPKSEPVFTPFETLQKNAAAAKAKLEAEKLQKASLEGVEEPKLAQPKTGIEKIRELMAKKNMRAVAPESTPKKTTADIVPRQEAIDEARALEEQARLKAIADKQAYEERQLEREASKKNKEEIRKNKELQKEAKRLAAQTETPAEKAYLDKASRGEAVTGERPQRTAREIAAATEQEILGSYKPSLAQPKAVPDTGASLREQAEAEKAALEKEQIRLAKEAQKIEGRHISNYSTTALEEMDKAAPKKIEAPKKKKNESKASWDERLAEWKKVTDERAEKRQLVKDELARRSESVATRERQAMVDKQMRIDAKAKADAEMRKTLERKGLGMAESLEEAAPSSSTSTLGRPKPVALSQPTPPTPSAPSEIDAKELRRQELMRQLAELDAPQKAPLAAPTQEVITPEGLKITMPVQPEAGLTPEQQASLAEAEAWDAEQKNRGARPKGRVDNTPKASGNPPRQTPPSRPGFMAVPSLETMGNVAGKVLNAAGLAAYGVGLAEHGPVEMAVGYGVPFTPWRYGIGPTLTAQAPERDPYAEARKNDPYFGMTPEERRRRMETEETIKKAVNTPINKIDFSTAELFKPRQ